MKKYAGVTLIILLSTNAFPSNCGAPVAFDNRTQDQIEVEVCIEYQQDKMNGCEFIWPHKAPAKAVSKVPLMYMCGYACDPPLRKYKILYRIKGEAAYTSLSYTNEPIVLE